jgi:hypothetical protein
MAGRPFAAIDKLCRNQFRSLNSDSLHSDHCFSWFCEGRVNYGFEARSGTLGKLVENLRLLGCLHFSLF